MGRVREQQFINYSREDPILRQTGEGGQRSGLPAPHSPGLPREVSVAPRTHLLPVFQSGLKEAVGELLPLLPPEPVVHGVQEVLD